MKIHEYQGKQILKKFNVPIQDGYTLNDIADAESVIKRVQKDFNTEDVIVKAQNHAGGRGKGGGVKYSPNYEAALNNAKNILGMNLITHQTGEEGKTVNTLFITEFKSISTSFFTARSPDGAMCLFLLRREMKRRCTLDKTISIKTTNMRVVVCICAYSSGPANCGYPTGKAVASMSRRSAG